VCVCVNQDVTNRCIAIQTLNSECFLPRHFSQSHQTLLHLDSSPNISPLDNLPPNFSPHSRRFPAICFPWTLLTTLCSGQLSVTAHNLLVNARQLIYKTAVINTCIYHKQVSRLNCYMRRT